MKIRRCDCCENMCEDYVCVTICCINGTKLFYDLCKDCYAEFINESMIIESEDEE